MNISRSTRVYRIPWTPSAFFLAVGLALLLLRASLSDPDCNRTRYRWSTFRKSCRHSFCCKADRSNKLTRLRSALVAFFLRHDSATRGNIWYVKG